MAGDLYDGDRIARRMIATRARARWLAVSDRAWSLDSPYEDDPLATLDARLDYAEFVREIHLRQHVVPQTPS